MEILNTNWGAPLHETFNGFLGFPDSSFGKESACNAGNSFDSWVRKIPWRRNRLPVPVFLGFPCGSAGKESTCNVGDLGLIPGLGRSPGEGKGYPLQYSGLENPRDGGAWWAAVSGVAQSWTRLKLLSSSSSLYHFYHSGILHVLPVVTVHLPPRL